jgi:hypothetical protein
MSSVTTELRRRLLVAIEEGALLAAGTDAYLLPLRGPRGWLCLVVGIDGPREKPYAAIVYTVLSWAMAVETFGHVPGLLSATRQMSLSA